ncbi:MAG: nucleotidyl transferase AbiEii/AbiGii toxin family protein [Proteobacteria bacterium]|nr:nucleotidyl transferase AbiEii/AbiGii toxin family protein [Pseudomonadota bacterium]
MIPRAYIDYWRSYAPWSSDAQVEQDLAIMRMIVMLFSDDTVRRELAFRGGTALHKLYLSPSARYSEDIDLVQRNAGPIGPLVDRIRELLDPVFGEPKRSRGEMMFTLYYRFRTEIEPAINTRIKIEINGREHGSVFGFRQLPQRVESPWFADGCEVTTYCVEELLGTKLRALYQRRKGRDLFDIFHAHTHLQPAPARCVEAFRMYLAQQGLRVSRSDFEANLAQKLLDQGFRSDIEPILRSDIDYDIDQAFQLLTSCYLPLLPL